MTGVLYGGVQEFCPGKNIIITTGRGQKKKHTTGDILDRLRKMVSSDAVKEDDFTETPSSEPRQPSQLQGKNSSSSTQQSIEDTE